MRIKFRISFGIQILPAALKWNCLPPGAARLRGRWSACAAPPTPTASATPDRAWRGCARSNLNPSWNRRFRCSEKEMVPLKASMKMDCPSSLIFELFHMFTNCQAMRIHPLYRNFLLWQCQKVARACFGSTRM